MLITTKGMLGEKPASVRPRRVIVHSYMRSGSTLCGDILQASPDVFYIYEPLLYLFDHNVPGKPVFTKHNLRCKESGTIVQKVLRLTMKETVEYLERDPDVLVIHLVRDPRGVYLSRKQYQPPNVPEMHVNYSNLCQRVWNDLHASMSMPAKYKGRVLTMRYEDLAENLQAMTTTMYRFLGLELSQSVLKFLSSTSQREIIAANGRPEVSSTKRKDPFKTAYKWRKELPFDVVKDIDHHCRDIYRALGYKTFKSETDLRNLQIPPKTKNFGQGLLIAKA
ncbi:carbohydrate sulfotransferase 1 [Aplysia californica]|uniref:Carbohydrate sulfotransferase 1 n=1 Tax=Aplysia californica TaxID=6500 RepID=A0ABM1VTG5_APLCA|nr:carbohydrate sulfotransferase 1 [Aplysia californica]